MITELVQKMIDRVDLSEQEARGAMEEIMAGQATDAQIAAFLEQLTAREIVPVVPPPPGVDLGDYKALIARRFARVVARSRSRPSVPLPR